MLIPKETLDSCRREAGHSLRVETSERVAVGLPLSEDRLPTQAGLSTLKGEELEKDTVVVDWYTPFGVVIGDTERRLCPSAPCVPVHAFPARLWTDQLLPLAAV
jgi:hypothetical protein